MIRHITNPMPNIMNGFQDGTAMSIIHVNNKSNNTAATKAIRNLNIPFMF